MEQVFVFDVVKRIRVISNIQKIYVHEIWETYIYKEKMERIKKNYGMAVEFTLCYRSQKGSLR